LTTRGETQLPLNHSVKQREGFGSHLPLILQLGGFLFSVQYFQ
jgi:hypothetical protein